MSNPVSAKLTHDDIERLRRERGRSMLLFITDRCPVGCRHCSVDSRDDSPSITDFALFDAILDWMCVTAELQVIGVSGGEPFVERRGLTTAVERLTAVGKRIVLFTSGVWASEIRPAAWIRGVLEKSSCVYLSTDAFHSEGVAEERFMRALHAAADAGAWIVVQVVDYGSAVAQAERLMQAVFGERVADYAELNRTVPLRNGRGVGVFDLPYRGVEGHEFGACPLARSPMVRYDGVITACCNEDVIMGHGPARLRRRARSAQEVADAVNDFHEDPMLRIIGDTALGILTLLPEHAGLAHQRFATNCELCWKVLEPGSERATNGLIQVIASVNRGQR